MPQNNFVLPFTMPERQLVRTFPPPYNEEISPYSELKDFSKVVRYELVESQRKYKLPPCKVIFVGDVSVGKTTIVNRFCYDKFQGKYKATIGVDFEIENFNIFGQNFTLEMWDTAGQERFKCIAQAYYRNANVIIVVFDMAKPDTLKSAKTWLKSALVVNSLQKPLIFLVGTKSDLLTSEEFIRVEKLAAEMAEGLKAEYWSLSARTGYKIIEFFQRVAALAFEATFRESIMQRVYMENSISTQMQKKSQYYDFRNNLIYSEDYCPKKRSTCLCEILFSLLTILL